MGIGTGIIEALLDFFFPPRCPKCRAYVEKKGGWCEECLREVICAARLPLPPEAAKVFRAVWAAGHYRGGMQNLIRGLKYHGKWGNLAYIRTVLDACGRCLQDIPASAVAVPVPLHPARERQRGFNQAELIFRPWLKDLGIPMERLLLRNRQTKPQYGLSREEREANLQGAFSLAEGMSADGRDILLVDDIMTTGATLLACANALRQGGAGRIYGFVLASDRG